MHLGSIGLVGGPAGSLAAVYERTVARRILGSSDRVIAVSNAVFDHGCALGVPRDKLSVVPNGVDGGSFHPAPYGRRTGKRKVLSIGRLVPNKGIEFLIAAAPAVLARHDVEFLVVGEGPRLEELDSLARRAGVRESFAFLGLVPSVGDLLRMCDVFVRPSLTEGMPLTVLEAMACGIPVVATSVGGTPEVVHHGSTGLLCAPGDARSLAAGINAVLDDPQLANRLRDNGRAFVKEGHDWEEVARMTGDVYASLRGAG
jgi:glycosyltransferase involved in cell wall biosynthesis